MLRLIAAIAAGIAVGWAVNRVSRRVPPTATLEPAPASIAVLPFADLSPKKDQEYYFSDGLAEEIIDALAHIDGLRVPGRTSSFFFKGKAARLGDIGRELHVAAVLEGSVRRVGNRVRVTTQIINVADGYRVWGQTYDRELTDIFAVQDEIARAVAEALNVKIVGQEVRASREHATRNPETYAQYLIGRHQYHQVTRQGYALAVQAYERALATEPGYAPAWAGLGLPLYLLAEDAESPAVAEALRQRAMAAAEKAVALAPDLTDALSTRGYLRAVIGLDWSGGVADLRRAVALNGKDADARRRHGLLLAHLGRTVEGIAEVRQAVELDPLGQSWVALGTLHQEAGQLGLAEVAFRRYLQISPESAPALLGLGRTLLLQGKAKEALATFERCPEDWRLWGRAVAEHSLGNPGASMTALDAFAARYGGTSAFRLAQAHAWRGEEARALELLERPLAEQGGLQVALKTDPFLRPLPGNTRYIALLQRMKLPVD